MASQPFPALDHAGFPHVIDAIFANASRGALIALREASRAFRDRADAQLMTHLIVDVVRPLDPDTLKVDRQSPPTVYLYTPGGRIPRALSWKPAREHYAQWQAWAPLLAHVRVVDYRDELLDSVRWRVLSKLLTGVEVIRTLSNYDSEINAHDETSAVRLRPRTFVQFSTQEPSPDERVFGALSIDAIPTGVTRCIVNFVCDVREPRLITFLNGALPPTLKEMTLIFSPRQGPAPRDPGEYEFPHAEATLHGFNAIAREIAAHALTVKFTLVGALDMHHRFFGFQDPYDQDELEPTLVDGMQYIAGRTLDPTRYDIEKVKAAIAKIEWLSRDQYRARTTAEEFALHTARWLPV